MRVTLVSHQIARNDGQGRVNYEIAIGMLNAGWEVTLVAMRFADDISRKPGVKIVALDFERWPTQLLRNFAFAIASAFWLRRNRKYIDVLHLNGGLTWANSDVNSAHFVHGAWLKNPFFPFSKWWRGPYVAYQHFYTLIGARLELPAFLETRTVVAVSNKVAAELRSIGVPPEKISVIYNGVDTEEFCPGPSERAGFGLPINVPLFLFAGDIRTTRKNLDTVLAALVRVDEIHLAVAGGTEGSPFPALAARLGLTDRVYFLGKVKKMSALMRSVDVLVFPSRYECMSLVILEALASGLPILTAETAGGAEIIGSAGRVLRNPDDVETLARWMNELKNDVAMRKTMGAHGRCIALAHSWEKMAAQYRGLYLSVKNSRPDETEGAWLSSKRRD